jgi:transmembrane 9 superfamily protein 3
LLRAENPRPIVAGETHPMTFSVSWTVRVVPFISCRLTLGMHSQETHDKTFANRFDRYLDFDFFEHQVCKRCPRCDLLPCSHRMEAGDLTWVACAQIHWFSIFNSFMMVIFLCGLVALILMRTLK